MINETIKYIKGDAEHRNRKRPTDTWRNHPPMSVKRNSLRKGADSLRKVDALICKYSDRIERKDDRLLKRKLKKREKEINELIDFREIV